MGHIEGGKLIFVCGEIAQTYRMREVYGRYFVVSTVEGLHLSVYGNPFGGLQVFF